MDASKRRICRDIASHYQSRVYDEAFKGVSPSTMYADSLVCTVCFRMYNAIDKFRQNMIWTSFSCKIKEKVRASHAFASDEVLREAIRLSSAHSTNKKPPLSIDLNDIKATYLKLSTPASPLKLSATFTHERMAKENRPASAGFRLTSNPDKALGIDKSNLNLRSKKLIQTSRPLQTIDDGSAIDSESCLTVAFTMQGSRAFS